MDLKNHVFIVSQDIIFDEVSSYYRVEGASIGGVGSNLHVHVNLYNEVSLPMTPCAHMLSNSSPSLSIGEQCDRKWC